MNLPSERTASTAMTLLNDLLQALLIPLAQWDVRFFGLEATLPVTPLLGIILLVLSDRALRWLTLRLRAVPQASVPAEESWESPRPGVVPVRS